MGKSSSAKPDYGQLMNASAEAQRSQAGYAQQMMDFTQQQYNENSPLMRQMADQQMGMASYQMDQGKAMGDMYRNTYMPMMEEQANSARNFNTEAHREGLAQEASADVARSFTNTKGMNDRNMASMGVNPNSGRFAGQQRGTSLAQAAQRAGAMTGTRRQAEAEGQNRVAMALNQGSNMSGQANAAFGSAMNAGNSAGGMLGLAGANYMSGLGQASGTMLAGQQMGLNGLQGALDGQMQMYQSGQQAKSDMWGGIGSMVGMAGGAFLGPMGAAYGAKLGGMAGAKAGG